MRKHLIALLLALGSILPLWGASEIPITVKRPLTGAPITLGIPFPLGALNAPENVRLLDSTGKEVPCQVTQVSTWEPRDNSIKWIWVFFFQTEEANYTLEFGDNISRAPLRGDKVVMINSQRSHGFAEINTGPLRLKVGKGEGGFLDFVQLDSNNDGFDASDTIAHSPTGRGSFLDILDDAGVDHSKAYITRTVKEKGSGPLHAILRIEGEYRYHRKDNNPSPFVIRLHAYAGKSYVKVLHTLTYTGVPDKHKPSQGEHAVIATQGEHIIDDSQTNDQGWMQPNDQIQAVGLNLNYRMDEAVQYQTGYQNGDWWQDSDEQMFQTQNVAGQTFSVHQTGPGSKVSANQETQDQRINGFKAVLRVNDKPHLTSSKASGWVNIHDQRWGVAAGIRHFVKEYPKELSVANNNLALYLWSPHAEPMSFARYSTEPTGQMLGNFAQGLTKTSEMVYYFYTPNQQSKVRSTLDYVLEPPVAHADPSWYTSTQVFGKIAPRKNDHLTYERGLDYKFKWILFNQQWEPWYGMFDYGDFKTFYIDNAWKVWANNEPAQDYMLWLQFVRTGDPKYYLAAEATSRHTMDVDNIHWPKGPRYIGDTNSSLDFWDFKEQPQATPYLGIGRRHSHQHWTALLSAHVWIQGWIASYYLTGYHRGLEAARLTADTYTRRIWGDHDLTGRRLYLSVWNMVEVWDATKNTCYQKDLEDRVSRMINLQQGPDQCNSLVMDRYGYAQVYASHGLSKYYQMTQDPKVKTALIQHARSVRDVPPWNHKYESYLSTIHSLLVGYELSGEQSFYQEALKRSQVLKTDQLKQFSEDINQKQFGMALEQVSHLPRDTEYHEGADLGLTIWSLSQGLRVYGWTHAYNTPYLLHWLREAETK